MIVRKALYTRIINIINKKFLIIMDLLDWKKLKEANLKLLQEYPIGTSVKKPNAAIGKITAVAIDETKADRPVFTISFSRNKGGVTVAVGEEVREFIPC